MNEHYQQLISLLGAMRALQAAPWPASLPPLYGLRDIGTSSTSTPESPDLVQEPDFGVLKPLSAGYVPWVLSDFADNEAGVWIHRIYLGVQPLKNVRHALFRQYQCEPPPDANAHAYTYLFSFALNAQGLALAGSFFTTGLARAFLIKNGIDPTQLQSAFTQRWQIDADAQNGNSAASFKRIHAQWRELIDYCAPLELPEKAVWVHSSLHQQPHVDDPYALVARDAEAEAQCLREYIADHAPSTVVARLFAQEESLTHKDILESIHGLVQSLQPHMLPAAAAGAEGLPLCEQASVNEIRQLLTQQEGVQSVHAPLGSAKNDVLLELAANQLLDRADCFFPMVDPRSLFERADPGDPAQVLQINPEVLNRMHTAVYCGDALQPNDSAFARFLWRWQNPLRHPGELCGWLQTLVEQLAAHYQNAATDTEAWLRLWRDAKHRMQEARVTLQFWRNRMSDGAAELQALYEAREKLLQATDHLQQSERQFTEFKSRIESLDAEEATLVRHSQQLEQALRDMQKTKPFALLVHTHALKKWEMDVTKLRQEIADTAKEQARLLERRRALQAQFAHHEKDVLAKTHDRKVLQQHIETMEGELLRLQQEQCQLPDDAFWSLSKKRQKRMRLWQSPNWHAARQALCNAALDMQAAVIMSNRVAWQDLLESSAALPRKMTALLLCTPLLRTQLECLPALFSGTESVDWAIVDNAHEVSLHQAMGVVWRANRLLCFGDTLRENTEPLPPPLWQRLAQDHGINADAARLYCTHSLQYFADHASVRGTTLWPNKPHQQWVGLPLRALDTHPALADISNILAYDGQLTGDLSLTESCAWPDNHWCDTPPQSTRPALAKQLKDLLKELECADHGDILIAAFPDDLLVDIRKVHKNSVDLMHAGQQRADAVVLVLGRPPAAESAQNMPPWPLAAQLITRARLRLYVIGNRGQWQHHPLFQNLMAFLDQGVITPSTTETALHQL